MNRVKRLEKALEVARQGLRMYASSSSVSGLLLTEITTAADDTLQEIDVLLTPPPEKEEVELPLFVAIHPEGYILAANASLPFLKSTYTLEGVVFLTTMIKVQRPLPAPVEKTAHGTATASGIVMDGEAPAPGTRCVVMWEEGGEHGFRDKVWVLNNATLVEDNGGACRWIRIAPFPEHVPTDQVGTLTYTWQEDQ